MERCYLLECATAPFTIFPLYKGTYILGRSLKCNFAVKEGGISRRHAEITVSDQGVALKDLDSLNGTYVDGVRVRECRVKSGQSIRFGDATFVLTIDTAQNHGLGVEEDTDPRDQSAQTPEPGADVLSYSQLRVNRLLLQGWPRQKIADTLRLTRHTIDFHVSSILRAFKVKSTPELLAKQLHKNGKSDNKKKP